MAIHHEPENDVNPTAGSGMTAADYAAMYRHTLQRLRAAGASNVVFVIAYMNIDKWNHLEARVVTLTNEARAKSGCAAVKTDIRLATAARTHNADMAKYNYVGHTGRDGSSLVDRAKRAGYTAAIGENREHRLGLPQA